MAPKVAAPQLSLLADNLNSVMARFSVDQAPRRVRYFVAQTACETAYFSKWTEDLLYTTPARLAAVWPYRFTCDANACTANLFYAPDYINNPQKLANLVYANRNGNGNAASNDGWSFRGRGAFNLTFLNNYAAASKFLFQDPSVFLNNPDTVAEIPNGVLASGWFWTINGLNAQADQDAFTRTTQIINGAQGQTLTNLVNERLVTLNLVNKIFQW